MNERKRIFDLVKQGVISTEEALVLLENIAKETPTARLQSKNILPLFLFGSEARMRELTMAPAPEALSKIPIPDDPTLRTSSAKIAAMEV